MIRNGAYALEVGLLKKPCRPMQVTKLPEPLQRAVEKAAKLHQARERVLKWAKRFARATGTWNEKHLRKAVAALERLEREGGK